MILGSGVTSVGTVLEVQTVPLKNFSRNPGKGGWVSQGFYTLTADGDYEAHVPMSAGVYAVQVRYLRTADGLAMEWEPLVKTAVALSVVQGGVDQETGEVMAPVAKASRAKRAA